MSSSTPASASLRSKATVIPSSRPVKLEWYEVVWSERIEPVRNRMLETLLDNDELALAS